MNIQVISFNCVLKNKAGQVISTTFNREVITAVDASNVVLTGLVKGLTNLSKGERRSITVAAEEAYGLYEPQKIILYPRKKLPQNLRVGDVVSVTSKSGAIRSYKVVQFHGDMVNLDGNHPLAGQDLIFEIETLDARDATREEIANAVNPISTRILH